MMRKFEGAQIRRLVRIERAERLNETRRVGVTVRVSKALVSVRPGCPASIGTKAEFWVTVENRGTAAAQDLILNDNWSEQLKPAKTPDMYDCSQPKPRTLRCKLGNFEAGRSEVYELSYFVSGLENDEACNNAWVPVSQTDPGYTEESESEVCFTLVKQLDLQPSELPPPKASITYRFMES